MINKQRLENDICTWDYTVNGYMEACGGSDGNIAYFPTIPITDALATCCNDPSCRGFSYTPEVTSSTNGKGIYKNN